MKRLMLMFAVVLFLAACGNNEESLPTTGNDSNNVNDEQSDEFEGKELRIDEEFEVNGADINLQSIRIKENRTNLYGSWKNHTLYEAHFNYLAPLTIYQGDEVIEILDEEKLNRKVKPGVAGTLDLKIDLNNYEDDIRLVFYNTDDDTKEEIIVEMK